MPGFAYGMQLQGGVAYGMQPHEYTQGHAYPPMWTSEGSFFDGMKIQRLGRHQTAAGGIHSKHGGVVGVVGLNEGKDQILLEDGTSVSLSENGTTWEYLT